MLALRTKLCQHSIIIERVFMRFIKKLLAFLLILILILLIVGFLLPEKVQVERSMIMNAPPEIVFNQINTTRAWESWSPWHEQDPDIELTYFGPPTGVGAGYEWKSKVVGNGRLTITESIPYSLVATDLDFLEKGRATGGYILDSVSGGTRVTWAMEADMGWNPISRYFGLFMDIMIGHEFEKGLNNLRRQVE